MDGEKIVISERRVQPLCVAVESHPEIIDELRELQESDRISNYPLHEFLILVSDPEDESIYSEKERNIISKLREKPLMIGDRWVDCYTINTGRLEDEGIVLRCGLTPTDIMHIRGDFSKYNKDISEICVNWLVRNRGFGDCRSFCEEVYDLMCKKLYENIVRILFTQKYPDVFKNGLSEEVKTLISKSWYEEENDRFFGFNLYSNASIVGIGAPTHIFLPRVCKKLRSKCIIPENGEVANAVGAVCADINARTSVKIAPISTSGGIRGYKVYCDEGAIEFKESEDAVEFAKKKAVEGAEFRAREHGAIGELDYEISVLYDNTADRSGKGILLGIEVVADAKGRIE